MNPPPRIDVLVVGATGSIGELVVAEAIRRGHRTGALVRNSRRAESLPASAQIVVGDLTRADTLAEAVDGANAVVFTHGSNGSAGRRGRRLRRRPQRAAGPRRPACPGRADDRHRGHPPLPRPRLEAPRRTACARQRTALHDRAARLVRLQRRRPARPCVPAGRPSAGRKPRRWCDLAPTDRRGSGRQPVLRSRGLEDLRAGGRPRSGPDRSGPTLRRSSPTPPARSTASSTPRTCRWPTSPARYARSSRPCAPRRPDRVDRQGAWRASRSTMYSDGWHSSGCS
jgi:hypothetical protein